MRSADAGCGLNQRAVMFEVNKLLYIRSPYHTYGIGTVILQAHNVSYFLHVKQFAYRTFLRQLWFDKLFLRRMLLLSTKIEMDMGAR
jgi:hypothetical protein